MNNAKAPFETVHRETSWTCPWYQVETSQLRLPDGSKGAYHVVRKSNAAWIVPVTGAGKVAMIKSYRYAVDDWCWEIPAGNIEPSQTPQEAAIAELREEVGGVASAWHYLGQAYTLNGICDEVGHFFIATGVALGKPSPEPLELFEVHLKSVNDVMAMARSGKISDGQSLLALFMAEPFLRRAD